MYITSGFMYYVLRIAIFFKQLCEDFYIISTGRESVRAGHIGTVIILINDVKKCIPSWQDCSAKVQRSLRPSSLPQRGRGNVYRGHGTRGMCGHLFPAPLKNNSCLPAWPHFSNMIGLVSVTPGDNFWLYQVTTLLSTRWFSAARQEPQGWSCW